MTIDTDGWSVDGRRGIKIGVGDEYAIAQELGNGFSITWTTSDSALTAVQKSLGTYRLSPDTAGVRSGQGDSHDYDEVPGRQVVPYARAKNPWWVKLRWQGIGDYVVFNDSGEDGVPNELATLGDPLSDQPESPRMSAEARKRRITELFGSTATPELARRAEAVLARLIETVAA